MDGWSLGWLLFALTVSAQETAPARAENALAEGRPAEAIQIYQALLKDRPSEGGLWLNLGIAQNMAGQPRAAVRSLQRAVELQPSLADAWTLLGSTQLELERTKAAVASLQRAVTLAPQRGDVRVLLAEALLANVQPDAAAAQLTTVLAASPRSAQALFALGRAREAQAQHAFETLRTRTPSSPYIQLLVGEVQSATGRPQEAIAAYEQGLAAEPAVADAWEDLATLYDAAGQPERAKEARLAAARQTPACAAQARPLACLYRQGELNALLARTADARDSAALYWRARAANALAAQSFARLESLPPSLETHEFRGRWFADQGRWLEAAQEWRAALALAPRRADLRPDLAVALLRTRQADEAVQILAPLVEGGQASAPLAFLYGDALLQAQRAAEAILWLTRALKQDPALTEAHASLGRAYVLADKPAEAIPHLKQATAINPEDADLWYQLARAYQATGETELAKSALEKFRVLQAAER